MNNADDGQGKTLLLKVRFREWLDTDDRLRVTDLRVAGYLLSCHDFRKGYGHPSYDDIAAALHIGRTTAIRCVARLLALEKFTLVHQGHGKGNANGYRPNFNAMPDGCAYTAARIKRASESSPKGVTSLTPFASISHKPKRYHAESQKVSNRCSKGVRAVTPLPYYTVYKDTSGEPPHRNRPSDTDRAVEVKIVRNLACKEGRKHTSSSVETPSLNGADIASLRDNEPETTAPFVPPPPAADFDPTDVIDALVCHLTVPRDLRQSEARSRFKRDAAIRAGEAAPIKPNGHRFTRLDDVLASAARLGIDRKSPT
jgi:hypothetical protein